MGLLNPCPQKAGRGFFICTYQEKRLFLSSCFSICARSNPLGSNIERGFKKFSFGFLGFIARSAVCGSGFFICWNSPEIDGIKTVLEGHFYLRKKYVAKGIAN